MPFAIALFGHIVVMLSALGMFFAGILHRFGALGTHSALAVFRGAAGANAAALLLCIVGVVLLVRAKQRRGLVPGILGILVGVAILTTSLYWKQRAETAPRIHDISTDLEHPPEFVALASVRSTSPNGVAYEGGQAPLEQRQAYPDLAPLVLNVPPGKLYEKALAAAKAMHWYIAAEDPASGRIEATDTSPFFGFKDDIVIRIAQDGSGSRLDVRSASRVGISDVGSNARRIRSFLEHVRH